MLRLLFLSNTLSELGMDSWQPGLLLGVNTHLSLCSSKLQLVIALVLHELFLYGHSFVFVIPILFIKSTQ